MDLTLTGEEIDQNLYVDLCPLLPDARWHSNSNLLSNTFSRTQPTFMEEDSSDPLTTTSIGPILPSTPNLNINRNPNSASQILNSSPSNSPSTSTVGLILDPDDSSSGLRNYHRDSTVWDPDDSSPGLRNHHRDSTVWGSDVHQTSLNDNPPGHQVAPTMLIPVADLVINGSLAGRVSSRDRLQENPQYRFQRLMEVNRNSMSTVLVHPDTSPERLRNNILALEASRRAKLKNGNGNDAEQKNDEGACQCGANFECNICFETSVEPVVTPCGHLFCWRCLYRWIRTQLGICECPVCKGEVTENSLTPIYGRGGTSSAPDPVPGLAMEEIPPRPNGRRSDSTRQLMMRERDVRGRGFGSQEVERVRMDLEAVLARLRQMPRSNRGGTSDVANQVEFAGGLIMGIGSGLPGEEVMEGGGGEGRGEGDGLESGAGSSVAGETHVRRRRRYR